MSNLSIIFRIDGQAAIHGLKANLTLCVCFQCIVMNCKHTLYRLAQTNNVTVMQSWSQVTVIRVTCDSSHLKVIILNDLMTWELFVTWLALCNLVTWLDLLGLQWLVCDLRVLESHMRTRYSRNGSCNSQNCSNLEKIFHTNICSGTGYIWNKESEKSGRYCETSKTTTSSARKQYVIEYILLTVFAGNTVSKDAGLRVSNVRQVRQHKTTTDWQD